MALDVGQATGPACPGRSELGQPLGEDPARAGARDEAEPPSLDTEGDEVSLPRQIGQDAPVSVAHRVQSLPAQRAGADG